MIRATVVVVIVMMVVTAHPAGKESEAARWKRRAMECVRWRKSGSGWRGGGVWRR